MTKRYLSYSDVARSLGITPGGLGRAHLPEPDVMVGSTRGWKPETIEAWIKARPGRGVGGGRPRKQTPTG